MNPNQRHNQPQIREPHPQRRSGWARNSRKTIRRTLTVLLLTLTAWAIQATVHAYATPTPLANLLPPGALLTIESPDFATLLHDWSNSPECKAWLASDNYTVFSNSRLFSRLGDAQSEFFSAAFAAQVPQAPALLTQVAGKQTVFAWYNVQRLEFLYITRMASAQALQTALLRERARFSPRQAGGHTFYIRQSRSSPTRTVAFATVSSPAGDLLLLATREDLLASSLELLASKQPADSLASEPWYTQAIAASVPTAPDPALHMVLNLDRLVPLPAFRSYWVQQNVSEMARYRAATADLYREPTGLREERTLLLKAVPAQASPAPNFTAPDLSALASLSPPSGVFRATVTDDPAEAIAALEKKLLGRPRLASSARQASEPSLSSPDSGDATDLETSIDTPPPVSAAASNQALAQALQSAGFDALLTYSSAEAAAPAAPLWVPIHSAVVLHSASALSLPAVEAALQQSLRGALTTGTLGIDFHPVPGTKLVALTGPKPLYLALEDGPHGHLAILADDPALATSFLSQPLNQSNQHPPDQPSEHATLIAGFNHTAQRGPYARLTSLIDGTNTAPSQPPTQPAYFSQNLRSLSDAFATLESERFTQTGRGPNQHQTVLYQWK